MWHDPCRSSILVLLLLCSMAGGEATAGSTNTWRPSCSCKWLLLLLVGWCPSGAHTWRPGYSCKRLLLLLLLVGWCPSSAHTAWPCLSLQVPARGLMLACSWCNTPTAAARAANTAALVGPHTTNSSSWCCCCCTTHSSCCGCTIARGPGTRNAHARRLLLLLLVVVKARPCCCTTRCSLAQVPSSSLLSHLGGDLSLPSCASCCIIKQQLPALTAPNSPLVPCRASCWNEHGRATSRASGATAAGCSSCSSSSTWLA